MVAAQYAAARDVPGSGDGNRVLMTTGTPAGARVWDKRRIAKHDRLAGARPHTDGKLIRPEALGQMLEVIIRPGDKVALEGDNQKQADFLSRTLAACDSAKLHDLHMLIGSVSRSEHLDLFEQGIAAKLDLAYAGPQSVRIAQLVEDGTVSIGAVHTYVELYARMVIDLRPDVALLCASAADEQGNLYTGPNTEDTPIIAEAAAFHDGIVVVQADEIVGPGELPRVDIPGDWVDLVVQADRPFFLEPLFTRDPKGIGPLQILQAMIALRGIYERHKVISLNPHPTLIPAIESGWVETVHSFGGESGMNGYVAARPDIFFNGSDGSLRSNRVLCQLAGQYAIDMFIGSTLQMDAEANSSTVTEGRLSGFGGAPNMGHDPHGRRHATPAWLDLRYGEGAGLRGRKLVVQIVETFQSSGTPTFVESLDAIRVGRDAGMPLPPIMIYGDDVSHVVTEEGVAYLYKAPSLEDRKAALAAIAGVTPLGRSADGSALDRLRADGLVALPADLGVDTSLADRSLLAARSIGDLVAWSGGLYEPPAQFRDW